ncbi:hypothetical protein SAMD00019534_059320 [Acytostelium subglobosum LB1]|uniref:hypothetical protein n=1 Tax=Acytostelium subglobosum LB1 TaxID=1410327 RepID=UPI000644CA2F|nr:hypothetical protein SAMD00019534_059320 [Acytostelium subglobosum LB1]GAM22757.1 hypothetical protein SAMD00019534_059320 [Acytostelium subglobosum LB1]|eukprot:XP_012753984.1 hypothetical protein SAMD00019534_059320 [Acytostelium subglobosum LB1]
MNLNPIYEVLRSRYYWRLIIPKNFESLLPRVEAHLGPATGSVIWRYRDWCSVERLLDNGYYALIEDKIVNGHELVDLDDASNISRLLQHISTRLFKYLIEHRPSLFEHPGILSNAICSGNEYVVEQLIEHQRQSQGALGQVMHGPGDLSPIQQALHHGHVHIAKILIQHGIHNIDEPINDLNYCVDGSFESPRFLLDHLNVTIEQLRSQIITFDDKADDDDDDDYSNCDDGNLDGPLIVL